ncbi:MAG: hypothetical protein FWE60_02545, partial [Oscillospiraceae bacterium]|nr:hypothetical protein [Oscillospiraceae bacterium]
RVQSLTWPWGSHSNVDYALTVNFTENPGNFEIEPNGSAGTATKINVNSPIIGNLHISSDVDFFEVTLLKSSRISINFKHDLVNTSNRLWDITMTALDGTVLSDFTSTGTSTDISDYIGYIGAGTYHIRVQSLTWPWGSYSNTDYILTVNDESITNIETNITSGKVSVEIDMGEGGYLLYDKDTALFSTHTIKAVVNKKTPGNEDKEKFFTALKKFLSQ